ncbi:hypothetical protein UO65_5914 [Actinokineospora spheciospongiae]|uniref:Uncharacterized protein n=1 Tax=Actinokineospora spheciospongiae TaxID=909613 RepID=W7IPZ0_9PSEU|nr:hypothetical protein UO65_5914 [Actinokineospora spheciospongiae]PWW62516.1 hypothetical protein DFQ13_105331 [Actinokineospora spheciospongiae]
MKRVNPDRKGWPTMTDPTRRDRRRDRNRLLRQLLTATVAVVIASATRR